MPSEKPEECAEASWYRLKCLGGHPHHGITECTPGTVYPASPPAPPSPSFSSAPCDAKQTITCDPFNENAYYKYNKDHAMYNISSYRVALPNGTGYWPWVGTGPFDKRTTPGTEAVFSFTPTATGRYWVDVCHIPGRCNGDFEDTDDAPAGGRRLEDVEGARRGRRLVDGQVWYYYKEADSCSPYGWTLLDTEWANRGSHDLTQTYMTVTAGVTYLILIEGQDTFEKDLYFRVQCPEPE